MVVFCVESEKDKAVKTFIRETHRRLVANSMQTFMFKNSSFAYVIEDKQKFLILVNIETPLVNFPRRFYFYIMKYAMRKKGYKKGFKLVQTNTILLKFARVFKNLPRRNTDVFKR